MILQLISSNSPLTLIINVAFYVFIFISIFYGQKLQYFIYSRQLETALIKFKDMRDETKDLAKTKIIELRKRLESKGESESSKITNKDLDAFLDEFLQFVMIEPVALDPSGIIPKLDHLLDVRETRWEGVVRTLLPGIDSGNCSNMQNLLEAAVAVDNVYRVVRHFFVQGKKSGSLMIVMQIAMQLKLIQQMAEAYVKASKAFYYGQPIGDGLGPLVAATFSRLANPDGVPSREMCKDTISQDVDYNGRRVIIVRAKGPGGTVGKPGEAIKMLVDEAKIDRILMVDAAMKMEGEKSGTVIEGVGAAIGGVGTEKYKIEASTTAYNIPVDAFLCRENLVDAITTMKKSISTSVKTVVEKVKNAIDTRTTEGDTVLLAGIGNTIGVGV
jgi:hypothetical protein